MKLWISYFLKGIYYWLCKVCLQQPPGVWLKLYWSIKWLKWQSFPTSQRLSTTAQLDIITNSRSLLKLRLNMVNYILHNFWCYHLNVQWGFPQSGETHPQETFWAWHELSDSEFTPISFWPLSLCFNRPLSATINSFSFHRYNLTVPIWPHPHLQWTYII